ncbi:MAG: type VI secretion system-associated FHA domain protein TagH [Comamonadaceae bacterium]|nr:MAG: type VI secretion system-associated FHA domain protein TagH [Comamonadaceae bacterium]
MIQIAVATRQGVPTEQALSAQFGPAGGTIGRADTNTLVLIDPDRTVSRVHAQVLCRDGEFFIVDRGSNPMQCNGQSLGSGREAALAAGDRLVIGSFELDVHAAAPASAQAASTGHAPLSAALSAGSASDDDPFADLLAGLATPAAPAPAARAPAQSADPVLFPNPMESQPRNARAAEVDPFADLLGPTPASAPSAGLGSLDDFSDLGVAKGGGKSNGIDDLFGGMGGLGMGSDPLALSPLADPLLQPNTASHTDPLAAFERKAPATPVPRADALPMGQFAYQPPRAVPVPEPDAPAVEFDDMTGLPKGVTAPSPATPFADLPAPAPAPAPATASASDDALLAAFLRGLGNQHQPPEALTPGLMERIGVLLRASTEGTLQLLLTRQEFKREVRAEVTMIASQANNPLKFSPTVEVALTHLLGPGVRGFMPPEAAMRDAYDDLRSHQFGVMVGMRAALAHVIERFSPDELEKKIAARSALDSLFAANRKAKLWDQFVALYGGIATEAEDDFHSLFGKAFIEAYEEQMTRLKSAQP